MGKHWYDEDGNPQHRITGANGKERDTTLRDAKKHGYFPSVTGVIDQLDKPALTKWKLEKLANVIVDDMERLHESGAFDGDDLGRAGYLKKCHERAMIDTVIARDEGARIHKAIENSYNNEEYDDKYEPHVKEVRRVILEMFGDREWWTEETFAHPLGYGGTVDLYSKGGDGWSDSVTLDFKTKDFDEKMPKGYPEQKMQLEACSNGVGIPDALIGNVFVSRTVAGLVHVEMYDKKDYWEQFKLLLQLWKRRNNCGSF
jgi:hypothetical protein